MSISYALPAIITCLTILTYIVVSFNVGRARMRNNVAPPITEGPDEFMRYFRAQQNMAEYLPAFIAALWIFSIYVSALLGAILGAIWLAARIAYAIGYYRESKKRMPGFIVSTFTLITLALGGLVGAVMAAAL